jgi:alkanesulfonate monooxygenase
MATMATSVLFHPLGSGGAWRHPGAPTSRVYDPDYYVEMAQLFERACLDVFFIADRPATVTENLDAHTRAPTFMSQFEPMTILSAMAMGTKHIGLGATVSTTFFEPYNIARQFASLDHISRGRAAWNVVTSASDYAPRNYGLDRMPAHADRYRQAREVVKIVESLWDTWEDDAFVYDKADAVTFVPEKYHVTDYHGEFFDIYGGLNVARPPQGHPVIIQAGQSEAGRELAAETAELVFAHGEDLAQAKAFSADLKSRMERYGRSTDELKVLVGLSPIIGDTHEEAVAIRDALSGYGHIDAAIVALENTLETKLRDLPLDEPIPLERIPASGNLHKQFFDWKAEQARSGRFTLREIATNGAGISGVPGSVTEIADRMEEWFLDGAADGFMIMFPQLPDGARAFCEKVVPELQRRGVMKTEYAGSTLRENLGLRRPEPAWAVEMPAVFR